MRRLTWLLLLAATVSACSGPSSPAAEADLSLFEFDIDVDRNVWSSQGVSLDVANDGEFAHTLIVTDENGVVVGASGLVVPETSVPVELDLEPGTYRVSCRIVVEDPNGNLIDHFEKGMHATVQVVES